MLKKLQIKFVLFNMAIVTIMLVIIFGLVYNFTRMSLEAESINMMKSIAASPFQLDPPKNSSPDLKLPFFTLRLGTNEVLISADGGYYDLSDKEFLDELIQQSLQSKNDIGIMKEHNLRFCRMKTPLETILVFSDMSSEKSALNHLLQSFAIIGSLSFFLFLIISTFLAKWAVRPVAAAWQQQKQFIADASHELKTPLTVVLTNTELLQSGEYTEDECHTFLQSISVMSCQMKQLVEKMLLLAKSDVQNASMPMTSVNLSRLVLDASISFEGVFVEKGLILESSAAPDIIVHGNENGLSQAVDILLDNAQKYALPGTGAKIQLYSSDRRKCRIQVSNPGTPMDEEELKAIFRRFYRIDKVRSRGSSFGLGLSIAENIVSQHKGKIWAESRNGINSFFIELHRVQESSICSSSSVSSRH